MSIVGESPPASPPEWGQPPDGPPRPHPDVPGARRPRRRRRLLVALMLVAATASGFGAWLGHPGTPARVGSTGADLALAAIEAKVDPAIVDVMSTIGYGSGTTAGTGIVLTASGEVVTNNHIIAGAAAISVTDLGDGRTYTATVRGYDRSDDIAVLQLEGASGLRTVTLGNSDRVAVGQAVVALGNAGGLGGRPSASTGLVTAVNQSITATDESGGLSEQLSGLIQTSATLEAGFSGGPLVDAAGDVIGIDTAASSGFQVDGGRGQSYAIPINQAIAIASQIDSGRASPTVHIDGTAFLGVQITSASGSAAPGAAVVAVVPGSPADIAGLAAGDVISRFAGQAVTSPADLTTLMDRHHPGDRITIGWSDPSGRDHSATITLAAGSAG